MKSDESFKNSGGVGEDQARLQDLERFLEGSFSQSVDQAIEYMEKVKLAPIYEDRHLLHYNLGHAYYLKGMMHKAQEEIYQALSLDPNNEIFLKTLGLVQRSLN
jgi:tetratricopeptide (TPR) repeat protein